MKNTNIIKVLISIFLLFILSGCLVEMGAKPQTRKATQEEIDIFYNAINELNITKCYELDPKSQIRRKHFFDYSTNEYELRNQCFYEIAVSKLDPTLCNEMKYIGNEKEVKIKKEDGTIVVTTLGLFESYKESCISEASER